MNTKLVSVVYGCLFCCTFLVAQTKSSILVQVEQNNQELKAYRSKLMAEIEERDGQNQLPPLEIKGYYLPLSTRANDPNYTEFEVSQSFAFPSVYATRKQWNRYKNEERALDYQQLRQDILLQAQQLSLTLASLKTRIEIVKRRHQSSFKVYEHIQALFDKGEIGIIEKQKAQVVSIQNQFEVASLELQYQNHMQAIIELNGGQSLEGTELPLTTHSEVVDFEVLWEEKLRLDPALIVLNSAITSAEFHVKVQKQQLLPEFSIGYNNQGINGERVSGITGGIAIPLWGRTSKIKAVKLQLTYQKTLANRSRSHLKSEYLQAFNEYQMLEANLASYKTSLEGLTVETLLTKAYQLGAYSFIEYQLELAFSYQAQDKLFDMELALQKQKAILFKHQL